ncbi:MAG: glycosyltransferase family 2 protein, partial [Pirellulaceae bacterium]
LFQSELVDFEVIVVDDGSVDNSVEVASRYEVRIISMACRSGPAAARNAGAREARGEYLVFIDADVFVRPDTLASLARTFAEDSEVDAVFGSYDTYPLAPNFVSHYKNLFHHYVHQMSHERASTFWSACGAVKRSVFIAVGGFDVNFRRPTVEDIELGLRLCRAGYHVVLNKQVQVTHAKSWSLGGMIKSDIFDRAIPWTRLMLREKSLPNDLNLIWPQRISAGLAFGIFAMLAVGSLRYPIILPIPLLVLALVLAIDYWSARTRIPNAARWLGVVVMLSALGVVGFLLRELALFSLLFAVAIVTLNAGFYRLFIRERNILFAVSIFPLHLLYYAYSGLVFVLVTGSYLLCPTALVRSARCASFGGSKNAASEIVDL